MFFVGIIGICNHINKLRDLPGLCCRVCGQKGYCSFVQVYKSFYLFGIDVFKWGSRYCIMCNKCKKVYDVVENQ